MLDKLIKMIAKGSSHHSFVSSTRVLLGPRLPYAKSRKKLRPYEVHIPSILSHIVLCWDINLFSGNQDVEAKLRAPDSGIADKCDMLHHSSASFFVQSSLVRHQQALEIKQHSAVQREDLLRLSEHHTLGTFHYS